MISVLSGTAANSSTFRQRASQFSSLGVRHGSRIPFALAALLLSACAPAPVKAPVQDEDAEEARPAPQSPKEEEVKSATPLPEVLPTAEEIQTERERVLALAAFRKSQTTNHLGVQSVLVARTSDLPWLLAFRNNSSESVDVLADPTLLSFEVKSNEELPEEPQKKPGKWAPRKAPAKLLCRAGEGTTKADASKYVTLSPGALLTYSFDPRPLCGADIPLVKGKKIVPAYGFPLTSKKVWKSGKSSEVTNENEPPFVARRTVTNPESPVPLKGLTFESFVLDETYPLDSVSPLEDETDAKAEAAKAAAEALPLKLSVKPLGTVSDADETVVNISLSNRGKESIVIFFRREHIVYEIQGPLGPTSCKMSPADRAPEASAYDTLSPGETSSLATRLAEACPLGTFDAAGVYNVSARLEARQSGHEVALEAFVGNVVTTTPAKLNVKGTNKAPRLTPVMRVITPTAPSAEDAMAAPASADPSPPVESPSNSDGAP